jgi:catechol 1,2-dioxygenase
MAELNIDGLLDKVLHDRIAPGNDRVRAIVNRITTDLYRTIEQLDVQPDEFWAAADWLTRLGASGQTGLITAGLGFDRLLDIRQDEADRRRGVKTGTPRAIEGPLFIPGAPASDFEVRLDEAQDHGECLVVEGTVRDLQGQPVAGATMDVWHANEHGRYSSFDPDQAPFHLRRRITANARGEYRYRTIVPPGYAIPPNSPTSELFAALGRHGNRPAHIHYLVSAPGLRALTTQVNLPGDPFLDDDFAYATRQELVLTLEDVPSPAGYESLGIDGPFKRARFDVTLPPAGSDRDAAHLGRAERVA